MDWDHNPTSGKWSLRRNQPNPYGNMYGEPTTWNVTVGEVFPPSTPFLDGFGHRKWKARLCSAYLATGLRGPVVQEAFDTCEEAKAWLQAVIALEEP